MQTSSQDSTESPRSPRTVVGVLLAFMGAIAITIGVTGSPVSGEPGTGEDAPCPAGTYLSWTDFYDPPATQITIPNLPVTFVSMYTSTGHVLIGDGTTMDGVVIDVIATAGGPALHAHFCKGVPTATTTTTTTTVPRTTTTTTVPRTTTTTTVPRTTTTTTTVPDSTTTSTSVAETTTTTTTVPDSTTTSTSVAETTTTTTTVPDSTTTSTSVAESTSTTSTSVAIFPPTTTTTTTVPASTTSVAVMAATTTSTTVARILPRTGSESPNSLLAIGALLATLGGVLLLSARRSSDLT